MKRLFNINVISFFLIAGIFIFWFSTAWKYTRGLVLPPIGDYQRDTAITLNILSGNIFGDAAYLGEHSWYSFLYHLLFAFYHKITGIPVLTLFIGYPFFITIPTIILFTFSVFKIFKSWAVSFIALFALVFIIPGTSINLHLAVSSWTFTFGTLTLSMFLFWRASSSSKSIDWILAGVGIALVIYSHIFAAITICGGIVFYQLWTRRFWKNLFLMVITAFIIASPFILPLLTVYHLQSRNIFQSQVQPYVITLNNIFYGYGNIRWVNSFFILTGLIVALLRRNRFDRLLLPMYFIGTFFLLIGLNRFYGEQLGLPFIALPAAMPWMEMWGFSHFSAVFLFSIGVGYWMRQIAKSFPAYKIKGISFLLLLFLFGYGVFMLPLFVEESRDWYYKNINSKPYNQDWMDFTDWTLKNTSIDNVFLGFPDPTSYVFVSGMTGRKAVAINNDHVNPFIDQPKRLDDLRFLYQTTDMDKFKKIASNYKISYVIVSPYESLIENADFAKFKKDPFFKSVFSKGEVSVYKLGWKNED